MPEPRPKRYPPPEFPPRRPALFATTPPAVFSVILGLLGLGLALRRLALAFGVGAGLVELALGLVVGLWLLAVVAIKVKVWRRFAVLAEDLRPLPGRAGLAAGAMTGMAMGGVVAPYAPGLAVFLVLASILAHVIMGLVLLRVMAAQGAEGWVPNPTWQLSFTGPIVAAAPLAVLGWTGLALVLTWAAVVTSAVIWVLSLRQLWREVPPAPLRPMLAIHLSPAALISLSFGLLGHPQVQMGFLALALALFVALLASARWLLVAGFSPAWGALTFPLAAFVQALTLAWPEAGLAVALIALGLIPTIAWKVLKLWPGGRLARVTNAAEA